MHNSHKNGAVSEYRAATWFSMQGWEVYWSNLGQSAVDFIISKNSEVLTVQVKTAFRLPKDGDIKYIKCNLSHGHKKGKLYRDNTFNLLTVCYGDDRIWVIPIEYIPHNLTQFSIWNHLKDTGYDEWLVKTKT